MSVKYTEDEMEEMQTAILDCKLSMDFRLNKMAEYLEDALAKLEETNKPGDIRLFRVTLSSEVRYYQGEKNFNRWFKYHRRRYSYIKGHEFVNGDWVEVV
jgi:hypothetical protein